MKIIKWVLIVFMFLILLIGLYVLSFLKDIPGLSTLTGAKGYRDLGVVSNIEETTKILEKNKFDLEEFDLTEFCVACGRRHEHKGTVDVKETVDSQFLTTLLQADSSSSNIFRDAQIKLDGNEGTLLIPLDNALGAPILAKGSISATGPTSVRINLSSASVGPVPIPEDYINEGEAWLNKEANKKLNTWEGLNIEILEVRNGKLQFDGTLPKSAR